MSKKLLSFVFAIVMIIIVYPADLIAVQAEDIVVPFEVGTVCKIGDSFSVSETCLLQFQNNAVTGEGSGLLESGEVYRLEYDRFIRGGQHHASRHVFNLIHGDSYRVLNVYDDRANKPYGITPILERQGYGDYCSKYIFAAVYLDFEGVKPEGFCGKYDENPHGIKVTVSNPTSDYTISYGISEGYYPNAESPTFTNPGDYEVFYKITADGYNTVTGSEKVIIDRLDCPLEIIMQNWTYGESPFLPIVPESSNPENTPIRFFYKKKNGEGEYSSEIPEKAGDYTLIAFRYGFIIYNDAVGTKDFTIYKATPDYSVPKMRFAKVGDILENVSLPAGWEWVDKTQLVGKAGKKRFPAVFTPEDTENYKTVTVDIPVKVIRTPLMIKANFIAGITGYSTENSIALKWHKAKNAKRYEIYATYCDKNHTKEYKKIKTVSGKISECEITKLEGESINPKKNVKVYIVAYKKENGKNVKMFKTPSFHIAGADSKYSNVKKINVSKNEYLLKNKQTAKIKPSLVLENGEKSAINHVAKYRYISTNKSVVTVNKNGKIKATGKGSATVYVYSGNGMAKAVSVTVE